MGSGVTQWGDLVLVTLLGMRSVLVTGDTWGVMESSQATPFPRPLANGWCLYK